MENNLEKKKKIFLSKSLFKHGKNQKVVGELNQMDFLYI